MTIRHPRLTAQDRFLMAALSIPPMLAFCTLLFIWVEKPFMRRDWPSRVAAWFRRPATP